MYSKDSQATIQKAGSKSSVQKAAFEFGITRFESSYLAIPIQLLAEVAQINSLMPILHRSTGIQGALNLRGRIIPIYDPSVLSGLSERPRIDPQFAVILKRNNQYIGLGVDEIEGLARISSEKIQRIDRIANTENNLEDTERSGVNRGICESCFARNGSFVGILCEERLFCNSALKGLHQPTNDDQDQNTIDVELNQSAIRIPALIFSSGRTCYALPASAIQGTIPRTSIERNALTSQSCIGSIRYHSQRVPILRTEVVTGLGSQGGNTEKETVVLRLENGGRVGLAVDSIDGMLNIDCEAYSPVAPALSKRNPTVSGMLSIGDNGKQIFLLNPEHLASHPLVNKLGELSLSEKKRDLKNQMHLDQKLELTLEQRRYLIFESGAVLATPADQVIKIMRLPDSVSPLSGCDMAGIKGVFREEGRPVLLVDLARYLGLTRKDSTCSRVVFVGYKEYRVGFAVGDVQGIETSKWRRSSLVGCNVGTIVQLGRSTNRRILPKIDLKKLAERICVQ